MLDSMLLRGCWFTDEESEAKGGCLTYLGPYSCSVMKLVFVSSWTKSEPSIPENLLMQSY